MFFESLFSHLLIDHNRDLEHVGKYFSSNLSLSFCATGKHLANEEVNNFQFFSVFCLMKEAKIILAKIWQGSHTWNRKSHNENKQVVSIWFSFLNNDVMLVSFSKRAACVIHCGFEALKNMHGRYKPRGIEIVVVISMHSCIMHRLIEFQTDFSLVTLSDFKIRLMVESRLLSFRLVNVCLISHENRKFSIVCLFFNTPWICVVYLNRPFSTVSGFCKFPDNFSSHTSFRRQA